MVCSNKEYYKWRDAKMSLPLAALIKEKNCKDDCVCERRGVCYECLKCYSNNGFWKKGELSSRFNKEVRELIKGLFKTKYGYLTKTGCSLSRDNMPETCVRYVCDKKETPIIITREQKEVIYGLGII